MNEIKRYAFPKRLKRRPTKQWLMKATYWHSAATENAMVLASGHVLGKPMSPLDRAQVVRRTNHMLHMVELCLVGLGCGAVGPILPVDRKAKNCRPPIPRALH